MSKTLQAKLGVIVAAIVLLISLAAFFVTNHSGAWLAVNNEADGGGMSVNVTEPLDVSADLHCYGVVEIDSENGIYRIPDADDGGEREERFELPLDDPNGISYSKYEKALVVVIEVQSDEEVHLIVHAGADNTAYDTETLVAQNNYFSNCVVITPAVFDDEGSTAQKNGETQRFTTLSDGSFSKVGELELYDAVIPAGVHTVSFILEYNVEYINYVTNYILHHDLDYFDVAFENDLHFLISKSE